MLDNGLGEVAASWARIVAQVGTTTRVCAYDRAGQGWSQDATSPHDGITAARDLHTLLRVAGEHGPYVLVGHSIGGTYAMTYAARYPEQVAGMVLLDSSSPEQFTAIPSYAGQWAVMHRALGLAPTLSRLGLGRVVAAVAPSHLPAPAADQVRALTASARAARSASAEWSALPQVFEQAQALTTLGGRPLAVLTASESLQKTSGWDAAQDELAALSTRSVHRVVDSTHTACSRTRTARQQRCAPSSTSSPRPATTRLGTRMTTVPAPPSPRTTTRPIPPPPPKELPCPRPHRLLTPSPPRPSSTRPRPRKSWALLGVALAAQVLVVLDISVVNTALPSIGRSLSLDGSQLQWLVTAYLMMSGGGLLLGGRIADLMSRRTVFLTGLGLFTAASLLSGFADSGGQLVATRSIQGLSAALLTPSALSLIMTTYAGAQRKTALAMWGAVGSLGVAAGVLLGGAITTWTSWQFIFWVNGPVGLVAFLVGGRIIAKDRVARPTLGAFDLPGSRGRHRGLASLVYGLGGTATHGWWSLHTAIAFAASFGAPR